MNGTPPRRGAISALYPGVNFTPRQRSLATRVLTGADVRFADLPPVLRAVALQLHRKDVVTFAPATNRLHLTANAVRGRG